MLRISPFRRPTGFKGLYIIFAICRKGQSWKPPGPEALLIQTWVNYIATNQCKKKSLQKLPQANAHTNTNTHTHTHTKGSILFTPDSSLQPLQISAIPLALGPELPLIEIPSVLRKLMLKGWVRSTDARRRALPGSSASTLSLWRLAASLPRSSARPW